MPKILRQILWALYGQSLFTIIALTMVWSDGQRPGDPLVTVLGMLLFLNVVIGVIFTTQLRKPGPSQESPR